MFRLTLPFLSILLAAEGAWAGGRVELNVFTDERVPVTGQQEWLQQLAEVGVTNLRIRAKQGGDKVGVETRGTPQSPVYLVTGMLNSASELVLPAGKFRSGQAAAVARWLNDLAQNGPPENRPKRLAFGLTAEQLDGLHKALAAKAIASTRGRDRAEAVEALAGQLPAPVRLSAEARQALQGDPVAEELSGLSIGTALAYALRPAGYCLVPHDAAGRVELSIRSSKETEEPWPVGWPSEKPIPELLPALYEPFNANIQGVSVKRVLDAISQRLKVPCLLDHNALARHGVEPEKALVNAPQSRTTYNNLLRKVLSQAKLKYEIRVDESGSPFLWVTTMKPL